MVSYLFSILAGVFVLMGPAVAGTYDTLYVFGDSYSDIGARFVDSNGPTAVAYLAQHMGIALTYPQDANPRNASLDFAASGASSGQEQGVIIHGHYWCCQGMTDQVEDFARRVRSGAVSFDSEATLFFIAGGLNDSQLSTASTIRNLTGQIKLLKELGARHIRLALLPTKIPEFAAVATRLNPAYRQLVPELRSSLQIDLRLSYWGEYFDEILEHADQYGIRNTTGRCAGRALFQEDITPCQSPQTYYYFHDGHPSTAVHRIVGDRLYQEILLQGGGRPTSASASRR